MCWDLSPLLEPVESSDTTQQDSILGGARLRNNRRAQEGMNTCINEYMGKKYILYHKYAHLMYGTQSRPSRKCFVRRDNVDRDSCEFRIR